MKIKAIKRFYDPFLKRHVLPNEVIEISKEHLSGYKPYIALKGEPEPTPEPEQTGDETTGEQENDDDVPKGEASKPKKKRGE